MITEIKKALLLKKGLIIILACIFAVFNCLVVLAEPVGISESRKNSPAVIKDISIYEGGTTIAPQSLTPQKDYDIKVTVIDNDGIGNSKGGLDELNVKLWYDKGGDDVLLNPPDKSVFNMYTNYNPQDSLKIKWVRGGEASLSGGGMTWELDEEKSMFPNSNNNDTTYEFVFNIKIGKIAKEASFTNRWQIAAKVVDVDGLVVCRAFENIAGFGLPMDFYGEIMMNTCKLDMNSLINDDSGDEIVYEVKDMAYISNSIYNTTVKADNVWVDSSDNKNVLFRMYSADAENTFAIKSNSISDVKTAKILPLNQSNSVIEKNVTASTSEHPGYKSNFLYILLNKNFNKDIIYRGTITYGINNSN